jgi:hypothetical protein
MQTMYVFGGSCQFILETVMRNKLIWICIPLALSCQPTFAGSSAILGKTIEVTGEVKETSGRQGLGEATKAVRWIRKARITRDGRIFVTYTTGQGGDMGYILKLNQSVNLASHV